VNGAKQDLTAHLPHAPGVYIFWGDSSLPLYIGKSVDIRSRVLSHFRQPDEARMLSQTRRIECLPTAGEIGALLLESRLIKSRQPMFNQRLRRTKQLHSWRLSEQATGLVNELVNSASVSHGQTPNLYGLFASRHAAQEKLRTLALDNNLCLASLGLEKATNRGCFGLQLHQCAGVCVGKEARASHDERLRSALQTMQVHVWPYASAIDVVEQSGDWVQKHRIFNWSYLGTWCSKGTVMESLQGTDTACFDADTYAILVKPLLKGEALLEAVLSQ
jgi:excinuclease Cho